MPKKIHEIIIEALDAYGARHGLKVPRHKTGRFLRIPALWRNSLDCNVSVAPNGTFTDFSQGEQSGKWPELKKLLKIEAATEAVAEVIDSAALKKDSRRRLALAQRTFAEAVPLAGAQERSAVEAYLAHRGLPADLLLPHLATLTRIGRSREGGIYWALPIFSPEGAHPLTGMQRIFLSPDGRKQADQKGGSKQMLGLHYTASVEAGGCLIPGDARRSGGRRVLCLGEGFETMLAVFAATGYPCYVLYDEGGVRKLSLDYLRALNPEAVWICADNDVKCAGEVAALVAAARLNAAGIACRICMPPRRYGGPKGSDWLDVWQACGARQTRRLLLMPRGWPSGSAPQLKRLFSRTGTGPRS